MSNSNWEAMDVGLVSQDNNRFSLYSTLSEWRKTERVNLAAVSAFGGNLKYVPENMMSEKLCRIAVNNYPFAVEDVPDRLLTPSFCEFAKQRLGDALIFTSNSRKIEDVLKQSNKNAVPQIGSKQKVIPKKKGRHL